MKPLASEVLVLLNNMLLMGIFLMEKDIIEKEKKKREICFEFINIFINKVI